MGAHKNLEQIKLVALHYAKEHKCNYNVILFNPNEDGEFDALASTSKFGRNLPCDCGSGKKFKKCCLYSAKNQ